MTNPPDGRVAAPATDLTGDRTAARHLGHRVHDR